MRRRWMVVMALLVLAVGVGVTWKQQRAALQARQEAEAAARRKLPELKAADAAIDSIDVEKPIITIWADVRKAPDIAGNFDIAADTVKAVGQALKRGVSDDLQGVEIVRIVFRAEAVDRFGHDVMARLVSLDIPAADLKTADYAKLNRGQALNLAYSASLGAPGSYDAIDAWCGDKARASADFCRKVRDKPST